MLLQSGTVKAILGDGREVALETYTCIIDWFGEQRELETVQTQAIFRCWESVCWRDWTFTLATDLAKS